MTPVAPADARDLDDTVLRPPRPPAVRLARLPEDFEDTVQRPPELHETSPVDPARASPAELVEPPPGLLGIQGIVPLRSSPTELVDNVWAEPVREAAPPFRLKLADGTLVPLDQPVYLGRKPSVPRIHPGGVPLLVTLDSPEREVSSTHLELTTVGGAVVASDMRSTNGSVLRIPGSSPRMLLGGESAVVTPGTVIELGDGNLVELLPPDRDAAHQPQAGGRA